MKNPDQNTAMIDSPEEKESLFSTGNRERIWTKYAGFLDLTINEFMDIQKDLLMDQINLTADTPAGWKLMNYSKPQSVSEFRSYIPLTNYENYASYLDIKNDDMLAEKPLYWVHTSGKSGSYKWIPYTKRAHRTCLESMVSSIFIACALKRNDVRISGNEHILFATPPYPYFAGMLSSTMSQLYDFVSIIPAENDTQNGLQRKMEDEFKLAMRTKIEILTSVTLVLSQISEQLEEGLSKIRFSPYLFHPASMLKLIRGWLISKIERRKLLPKDIWRPRAIVCGGTDTNIYRNKITEFWGKEPFEIYTSSEAGLLGMQSWTRKGMTLLPFSGFYEFIPESEWLRNKHDSTYQPSTVLINELKEGQKYELVITNFYGMPFLRYRLGDLIRVLSLKDDEAEISLPQITFESRTDDIIDIPGFAGLDKKTIWQAISSCDIDYYDWTIHKELQNNEPILHLYIELREQSTPEYVEHEVDHALTELNPDYKYLKNILGFNPLKVTLLAKNTFLRYYQEQQGKEADPAQLNPSHICPSDSVIEALLKVHDDNRRK